MNGTITKLDKNPINTNKKTPRTEILLEDNLFDPLYIPEDNVEDKLASLFRRTDEKLNLDNNITHITSALKIELLKSNKLLPTYTIKTRTLKIGAEKRIAKRITKQQKNQKKRECMRKYNIKRKASGEYKKYLEYQNQYRKQNCQIIKTNQSKIYYRLKKYDPESYKRKL